MKHYYLIVDTETTAKQTVADFGAVIMDRKGNIVEQFGVLLDGHFGTLPLWSDPRAPAEAFWSTQMAHRRKKHYDDLLTAGQRSICSPALVNLWLARVKGQYDPAVTAYNIGFDWSKCRNTGIDLGIFQTRFCTMKAARAFIATRADYVDFCQARGLLTGMGQPKTSADAMAKYVIDRQHSGSLADEPHTALEDARDYEAPILAHILRDLSRKKLLDASRY
jgi:hypothetical protein